MPPLPLNFHTPTLDTPRTPQLSAEAPTFCPNGNATTRTMPATQTDARANISAEVQTAQKPQEPTLVMPRQERADGTTSDAPDPPGDGRAPLHSAEGKTATSRSRATQPEGTDGTDQGEEEYDR